MGKRRPKAGAVAEFVVGGEDIGHIGDASAIEPQIKYTSAWRGHRALVKGAR